MSLQCGVRRVEAVVHGGFARVTRTANWPVWLCVAVIGWADRTVAAEAAKHATPARVSQLDRAAFSQWSEGRESPVPSEVARDGPREVIWTQEKTTEIRGVAFGTTRRPGTRHLRIGFTEPIALGAVLVRGGGALSVLKPDAAYPGDLGDDPQWQPAERFNPPPAAGREGYAVWTLPPGTRSRALRFTHVAEPSDPDPAGWLGGAWVLPDRVTNLAPQAAITATARAESADLLTDESHNPQWAPWDNGEGGAALPISPEHPETITLAWPSAVKLRGVCLLWAGLGAADVDALSGPDDLVPQTAPAAAWRRVASSDSIDPLYPIPLAPNWLDFGATRTTRPTATASASSGATTARSRGWWRRWEIRTSGQC
jgi:hypothetical protein